HHGQLRSRRADAPARLGGAARLGAALRAAAAGSGRGRGGHVPPRLDGDLYVRSGGRGAPGGGRRSGGDGGGAAGRGRRAAAGRRARARSPPNGDGGRLSGREPSDGEIDFSDRELSEMNADVAGREPGAGGGEARPRRRSMLRVPADQVPRPTFTTEPSLPAF